MHYPWARLSIEVTKYITDYLFMAHTCMQNLHLSLFSYITFSIKRNTEIYSNKILRFSQSHSIHITLLLYTNVQLCIIMNFFHIATNKYSRRKEMG